jgi:large subunit ribosomal protein L18Ae
MGIREFQVIGRKKPTATLAKPPIFRMRIFAPNDVIAKSRFWYFMNSLKKIKRVNGEILAINEIYDSRPKQVKNYQIALRYQSRTANHNITKEFRDVTRTGAVDQLLSDMAGRHRTTYRKIQIMEVKTVPANEETRVKQNLKSAPLSNQQFFDAQIKFPLTHRVLRHPSKSGRTLFKAKRPGSITTHFQ